MVNVKVVALLPHWLYSSRNWKDWINHLLWSSVSATLPETYVDGRGGHLCAIRFHCSNWRRPLDDSFTGSSNWKSNLYVVFQSYIFAADLSLVDLVAPAQIGKHNAERQSFGSSALIDPWGTVVAKAPERECLIFGEIDREYLQTVRKNMPVTSHKVKDIDF